MMTMTATITNKSTTGTTTAAIITAVQRVVQRVKYFYQTVNKHCTLFCKRENMSQKLRQYLPLVEGESLESISKKIRD